MASSIQQTTLPIPDEIARAILSYVLDPSVELVCKSWRALSQSLVQTQLRSFSEVTSEDPTNNKAKEIFIAIFRERNRLIPEDARRSYDGFPFISCARYKFVYWDVKEAYRFLDSELLRNRRTCKFVCNLPTRGDLPELQSLTLDVHNLFGFAPELPVDLPRCAALRKLTIEDDKRHSTVFPPIEDLRPRFICESRAVSPFQDQLGVLPLLTHLSLRTLQLGVIPTDIGSFDALTFLDLSGNELTYLPKEVGKLSSLKKLFLHSNDFEQFPPSILQLTSLEGLLLFGNHLTGIPFEISKLSHLQSLNLSSNNITVLPSSLGVCTSLTGLQLDQNRLESLPGAIGELTNLTDLRLADNPLTSLPTKMRDLGPSISFSDEQRLDKLTGSKAYFLIRLKSKGIHESFIYNFLKFSKQEMQEFLDVYNKYLLRCSQEEDTTDRDPAAEEDEALRRAFYYTKERGTICVWPAFHKE